jgi:hypothetical protein
MADEPTQKKNGNGMKPWAALDRRTIIYLSVVGAWLFSAMVWTVGLTTLAFFGKDTIGANGLVISTSADEVKALLEVAEGVMVFLAAPALVIIMTEVNAAQNERKNGNGKD